MLSGGLEQAAAKAEVVRRRRRRWCGGDEGEHRLIAAWSWKGAARVELIRFIQCTE
eukprot:SAG11_NODE_540_length_8654_cov_9.626110_5_plen_56_part_00